MRDCMDRIEWWIRRQHEHGATHTRHEVRLKVDPKTGPKAALIDTADKTLIATGRGPSVADALVNLCDQIGAPT